MNGQCWLNRTEVEYAQGDEIFKLQRMKKNINLLVYEITECHHQEYKRPFFSGLFKIFQK